MAFVLMYWQPLLLAVVLVALYVLTKYANFKAKSVAVAYLEKAKEELENATDTKIAAIAEVAYATIPRRYRVFVPNVLFVDLFTKLYKEAVKVVK